MFAPSNFSPLGSGSYVMSRVPATTTPSLIFSGSSFGRRGGTVFNHAAGALYLSTQPSASAQLFFVKLTSGSYYELDKPSYTGEIWGAWDAAGGYAMVIDKQSSE